MLNGDMMNCTNNLIGGKYVNLSGKYFTVQSQFYDDFNVLVADSSNIDILVAISKTKGAWSECQKMSFGERSAIIKEAAARLVFSEEEITAIVKTLGTPIRYIREQVAQIPKIMRSFSVTISKRYGIIEGRIGLDFIENKTFSKIEFRIAKKGLIYALTPGNDIRTTAVVSTISVLLGIPLIIKPSRTDNIIPLKITKAIIEAGYPKNGLSVIFFNTDNPSSKKLNFKLCDEATVVWPFGDEETVDDSIRFERIKLLEIEKILKASGVPDAGEGIIKFLNNAQAKHNPLDAYMSEQTVDHFASKIVLRHASGRCAGILDSDFDLQRAAKLIMESSMEYPKSCSSMKSVFVVETVFEKFIKILKQEFEDLDRYVADPLKPKTKVGYVDKGTVSFLEKRIMELKRLQLVSILHGGKKINQTQLTPILLSTSDINSELLIKEIPGYILCLIEVGSFEEAVSQINRISKDNPKLAVSYFTNNPNNMRLYINAHHVKINHTTTDLDGIIHEGNDYIMKLTRPYMVHVHKVDLKEHPYGHR